MYRTDAADWLRRRRPNLTHLQPNPGTGLVVHGHLVITGNASLPNGNSSACAYVEAIGGEIVIGGKITIARNT